ncbi:MAG: hypothetical protein JRI53_08080 [Deltaproteobacteria bacterium]|nr:hypothetical protein [Deltaproteobacteria bacterium]
MIKVAEIAYMYKLSKKNGHPETTDALYGLLLHGLGERQKQAVTLINANGPMRCVEVAAKLHISRRNTSSLLYILATYGLVRYETVIDHKGSHYEWKGIE